jgi:hypothetical protein
MIFVLGSKLEVLTKLVLQWKLKNKSGHIVDFLKQQGTINFHSFVNYHSTFSSSMVIILFLEMSIFLKIICSKFKEITRERKTQNFVKTHEVITLGQSNIALQVSNN